MQNNTTENNELLDILGAIELPKEIIENIDKPVKKEKLITTTFLVKIVSEEKKKSNSNKIKKKKSIVLKQFLSVCLFGFKYITTSVLIFGILLVSTNFSAYSNIIQSYLFKSEHKQVAASLLNSVDASEIIEPKKKLIHRKTKKEKIEELKATNLKINNITNSFSIKQIVKNNEKNIDLDIDIVPYENRLVIPKIGKNVPLIDIVEKTVDSKSKLDNILMKELEFGVVRYPGSARPGKNGNSFIFGHSSNFPWIAGKYNDVFARLGQMEKGDTIYSYYGQKKYKYKIIEKKVVSPNDVGVLKNDKNKKQLTLMTCWPIGTDINRLILIADLVEVK